MNPLKQALLELWDALTNGTHLTDNEQKMIYQLRAISATDNQREAITRLIIYGAEPELIHTYAIMTATGTITTENLNDLSAHGIQERKTK